MTTTTQAKRRMTKPATNGSATEPETETVQAPAAAPELLMLPLTRIVPSSENPRRSLGDLTELAASIAGVGLLEPLIVARPTPFAPGVYPLVAGHRRLAAAQLAGLDEVPAIVRSMSDREQLEAMLVENLQRTDLAPLEEAAAYRRLVDDLGMTQRALGARIGRSQSHIAKRLALLELPDEAKTALDSGRIVLEEAALLGKLTEHPERLAVALQEGTRFDYSSVRETAERQLDELETEEQAAKLEADLQAQGHKVLPTLKPGSSLGREGLLVQSDSWMVPHQVALPFSVPRHEAESCHAAVIAVRYRSPQVFWVCTNPARHEPDGASELKLPKESQRPDKTPEEIARAERRKQELAATKARKEFLRQLLERIDAEIARGGRNTSADVAHVFGMVLADANHAPARTACELLGIPPVETERSYGGTEKNYQVALEAFGEDGRPGARLRAVLALTFGLGEELAQSPWSGSWASGKVAHHIAYLQAAGYELSEFEKAELEAAPDDAGDAFEDNDDFEVAECRVCGCTEDDACEGGCHWVPDPELLGDLCSHCLEEEQRADPYANGGPE
jgi:ParB family transcriptional regulator, chromosome partitioning protein